MKRTLKRELKVLEIVEMEALGFSGCFCFCVGVLMLVCLVFFN